MRLAVVERSNVVVAHPGSWSSDALSDSLNGVFASPSAISAAGTHVSKALTGPAMPGAASRSGRRVLADEARSVGDWAHDTRPRSARVFIWLLVGCAAVCASRHQGKLHCERSEMLYTILVILLIVVLALIIWRMVAGRRAI